MKDIQDIMEIKISGLMVKRAVKTAMNEQGLTKEQIVAAVQIAIKGKKDVSGDEITFSLAGLDRIYRNDLPAKGCGIILRALAKVCQCSVSSFAEPETKTA